MPCSEDDDSQTGFVQGPTQGMSKAELRKTNKPIMEKKRRARINNCLNELKDLLLDAMDKDPNRHSKLEKADILELTVKHLQTLQRQQLAAAIASDPSVLHRFKSGFGDCAVEVRRYLSRLASVPTGLRHRLGNHLNSCISGIEHLNPLPQDYPQLVPDPLRLDGERTSAFHYVRATRLNSPPLSPLSCDSACDSSTEMETPPRVFQTYPFPTPPSRSASDQDSSPETQKPTVSSTTISPENLKQESMKHKKLMEPLSIVIDVENYKIGIDASPKRAVDYSMRKLKRPLVETSGPNAKLMKIDALTDAKVSIRTTTKEVTIEPKILTETPVRRSAFEIRIPERVPVFCERLPVPERRLILSEPPPIPAVPTLPRSVISHTAASLAQSSYQVLPAAVPLPNVLPTNKSSFQVLPAAVPLPLPNVLPTNYRENERADAGSRSNDQVPSGSSEMWRPW